MILQRVNGGFNERLKNSTQIRHIEAGGCCNGDEKVARRFNRLGDHRINAAANEKRKGEGRREKQLASRARALSSSAETLKHKDGIHLQSFSIYLGWSVISTSFTYSITGRERERRLEIHNSRSTETAATLRRGSIAEASRTKDVTRRESPSSARCVSPAESTVERRTERACHANYERRR